MSLNPKQIILSVALLSLVSCGETPTSQLTEQFPIIRSGPHDMEFAFIPSGTFRMGSSDGEEGRGDNEYRHWVKLTEDFEMQTTEVTRRQWREIMFSDPGGDKYCESRPSFVKDDDHPVTCVSWVEVDRFINKLNKSRVKSGYRYSLPTEAQWEYATRAYTEQSYSISGRLNSFAWYKSVSNGPQPVGKLKANFFGLYDVHGNVWEWTSDIYKENYPETKSFFNPIENPKGPKSENKTYDRGGDVKEKIHVFRGGGWAFQPEYCRSATRNRGMAHDRYQYVGFRLMRTKI